MKAGQGTGLAAVAIGSMFIYAGIKGFSILKAAQNVIRGTAPGQGQKAATLDIPGGSGSGSGGNGGTVHSGSGQAALHATASDFGWGSGQEWADFQSLEMSEAGFNPKIKNPSSGALGMAQALGHGTGNTRGSLGNEYGNFGLTDAQNKAANSGDAGAQALWMCRYIKQQYGSPSKAWAFHRANNWY